MYSEIVYFNRGEIYKQYCGEERWPTFNAGGVTSVYRAARPDEVDLGEMTRFVSVKRLSDGSTRTKRYRSTAQLRSIMNISGGVAPIPELMCPSVNLWVMEARMDEDADFYELYFHAESGSLLERVANHYSLPHPLTPELTAAMEANPEKWSLRYINLGKGKQHVVVGSVVFKSGAPTILKVYKSETSRPPIKV